MGWSEDIEMATSNPVIPPPMQSQLPAVNLNPHVHMLHTIPSGREQLKKAKLRLESYQKNKTAKCRMRRRLEYVQYTHAKSRIPVDPHNPTRTHRRISLDTEGVVYAMYSRKYGDRVYVGITSFSAYHWYKQHLRAAKRYLLTPPEGRDRYNSTHALYRVWGNYGTRDTAIIPLQVVGKHEDYANSADFHAHNDHHEAWWMNTLKTIQPRGFNVRNIAYVKRARNRATAQRKRSHHQVQAVPPQLALASDDSDDGVDNDTPLSDPHDPPGMVLDPNFHSDYLDEGTPPPPPPSPSGPVLAHAQAGPMGLQGDDGGGPVSASAKPYSAYARCAYTHMLHLRQRQTPACWNAVLSQPLRLNAVENPILMYLKPFRTRRLSKMSAVLTSVSVYRSLTGAALRRPPLAGHLMMSCSCRHALHLPLKIMYSRPQLLLLMLSVDC